MKLFPSHTTNNDIDLSKFSEEEYATIQNYNALIKSYKKEYGIDFHVVSVINNDSKNQLKHNTKIMDLLRDNEFLNELMFPNYSFDMSRGVNATINTNIHKVGEIFVKKS